jgi:hypothetical protein
MRVAILSTLGWEHSRINLQHVVLRWAADKSKVLFLGGTVAALDPISPNSLWVFLENVCTKTGQGACRNWKLILTLLSALPLQKRSASLKSLSGGLVHVFWTVADWHVFRPHLQFHVEIRCSVFYLDTIFKVLPILNMYLDYIFCNVLIILFLFLCPGWLNISRLAFVSDLESVLLPRGSCSTWYSPSRKLFKLQWIINFMSMFDVYKRNFFTRMLKKLWVLTVLKSLSIFETFVLCMFVTTASVV